MEQKETVCSVAKKCGGCRYQGEPYQDQLRKKQKITEGLLKNSVKLSRSSEWKILIITEIKCMRRLAVTGKEM